MFSKRGLRKRQQPRSLRREALVDAAGILPTLDPSTALLLTAFQQLLVELLEIRHFGHWDQKVPAGKTDEPFHAPFLPSLTRGAESGPVRVVTSKGDEALLLDPLLPSQDPLDRQAQVVVDQFRKDAPEVLERLHVSVEEHLLPLPGIGADERLPRIPGPHREELDPPPLSAHPHPGHPPIYFGFPGRLRVQRHDRLLLSPTLGRLPFPHPSPHRGLAPLKAFFFHQPGVDPPGRVPLLDRSLPVFRQPPLDRLCHRSHHRLGNRLDSPVLRLQSLEGLANRHSMMSRLPLDLTDTLSVDTVGRSDKLVLIHPNQLPTFVLTVSWSPTA